MLLVIYLVITGTNYCTWQLCSNPELELFVHPFFSHLVLISIMHSWRKANSTWATPSYRHCCYSPELLWHCCLTSLKMLKGCCCFSSFFAKETWTDQEGSWIPCGESQVGLYCVKKHSGPDYSDSTLLFKVSIYMQDILKSSNEVFFPVCAYSSDTWLKILGIKNLLLVSKPNEKLCYTCHDAMAQWHSGTVNALFFWTCHHYVVEYVSLRYS